MSDVTEAITNVLFEDPKMAAYAILDGALIDGLERQLDSQAAHYVCLYRGEIEPWLKRVAPYLVRLEQPSPLLEWVIEGGWGKHWGVFLNSSADMVTLRRHFRQFLLVRVPDEPDQVYFRYYDPRVLKTYLPSCNSPELRAFFGPVHRYLQEADRADEMSIMRFENGRLVLDSIGLR